MESTADRVNALAAAGEVTPAVAVLVVALRQALRDRQRLRGELGEVQATIDVLLTQLREFGAVP
jgi:hypothetical protein